jgi:ApbE superfamily uncharacterized protein (UPF0280 family)
MKRLPQIGLLPGGKRLHLQDGPIDLIVEAKGKAVDVNAAYDAAARRFTGLLDELCEELSELRRAADPVQCSLTGVVARRMHAAVAPFAVDCFITPMAAVAGAVADAMLETITAAGDLQRAYVNNGGDIAFHLAPGESLTAGLVADVARPAILGHIAIEHALPARGLATSGWGGRSFSLGIADAVSILARNAAAADAAATIVANAVDIDHPAVRRAPAASITDDSDLGERLVTIEVGVLPMLAIEQALANGRRVAEPLYAAGQIAGAVLVVKGCTAVVPEGIAAIARSDADRLLLNAR